MTYHQSTPIRYPRTARPQLIKRNPLRRRLPFPPPFRLFRFTLLPFPPSHTNLAEMLRKTRRTSLTMLNFSLVQTTNQSTRVCYGGEQVLCPGRREEECETVERFWCGGKWGSGRPVEENEGNTVIGGSRMQTSTGHPKLYGEKEIKIVDHAEFLD